MPLSLMPMFFKRTEAMWNMRIKMDKKFIKLISFTPDDENVRFIRIGLFKILLLAGLILSLSIFLVGAASKALFSFKQDSRIETLQKENELLEKFLTGFSEKTKNIESRLELIRHRENTFRIFANIQEIDEDTWDIGTGGSDRPTFWNKGLNYSAHQDSAMDILILLERLEQQANLLLESQSHIEKKFVDDQNFRLHTPTIFPVNKGAVTSKFGYRKDPFIQQMKHHNGLDIVAEKGAHVIAPSNGTVVLARKSYKPGESLGRAIVIDHGFGIRTRYGHLSKIYVHVGDKVKRYDVIGEVGSTGRSTGPHLHYEVIAKGKFQNPEDYILN